jgi:hypothetical protein
MKTINTFKWRNLDDQYIYNWLVGKYPEHWNAIVKATPKKRREEFTLCNVNRSFYEVEKEFDNNVFINN